MKTEIRFWHAALPILFLLGLVVYGLILRPRVWGQSAFPLEIIFILAAAFTMVELAWLGFAWKEIETAVTHKLKSALPAFFILFAIGLVIGAWMVSGTIPMLVYYGLQWVQPSFLYVFAFGVPIVFSLLTGTSWGSVGAVGIVLMGISDALGGHPGITAGAVIGGAYFGDKMSPLSDTTNLAALAVEVDLFDHIRSMMVTTLPSACLAAIGYLSLGRFYPPDALVGWATRQALLEALSTIFHFHPLLLLPPVIVLLASWARKPTVPTLFVSTVTASVLALIVQPFTLADVLTSLRDGFRLDMAPWLTTSPDEVSVLLERGGLLALIDAIVVTFTVFLFIGAMDYIDGIPMVIGRVFSFAKSRVSMNLSALAATAMTNALTSSQYATSFIVGDAFKSRFDALRIPRKVLSRSLEDAGTMIESLVPWTPTAVFMVATLGVPYADYWSWQLLSLINLVLAPILVVLGVGCFYGEIHAHEPKS